MTVSESHTYTEIISQTEAWAQALDIVNASSLPKVGDYDQILFTGCGSFVSRVDRSRSALLLCVTPMEVDK